MSLNIYKPNQLISLIDSLHQKKSNGILSLTTRVDTWRQQRFCILILRNGELVYAGNRVPTAYELCRNLGEILKPNLIKAGLSVAIEKASNSNSTVEILDMLIRIRAFTWQEVEALMNTKVLLILEKFIYHPGETKWEISDDFDLSYGKDRHGLNWAEIQQELKNRQQQWQKFMPQIPGMDAIPVVTNQQLSLINNKQVADHFSKSVDGNSTLVDIAEKMGKDPLKVAKSYVRWVNNGWVSFTDHSSTISNVSGVRTKISPDLKTIKAQEQENNPATVVPGQTENKQNLPIVLSVDDSPIVQISIKRALQDHYHVLLANKATQALEILHQGKVELMLLDLTMPDVDGLEFCKTIRDMPKFKDLPVVMVTARDGLVNKMKGRIAGTSKYITKPFKPEELRQVVSQYINS